MNRPVPYITANSRVPLGEVPSMPLSPNTEAAQPTSKQSESTFHPGVGAYQVRRRVSGELPAWVQQHAAARRRPQQSEFENRHTGVPEAKVEASLIYSVTAEPEAPLVEVVSKRGRKSRFRCFKKMLKRNREKSPASNDLRDALAQHHLPKEKSREEPEEQVVRLSPARASSCGFHANDDGDQPRDSAEIYEVADLSPETIMNEEMKTALEVFPDASHDRITSLLRQFSFSTTMQYLAEESFVVAETDRMETPRALQPSTSYDQVDPAEKETLVWSVQEMFPQIPREEIERELDEHSVSTAVAILSSRAPELFAELSSEFRPGDSLWALPSLQRGGETTNHTSNIQDSWQRCLKTGTYRNDQYNEREIWREEREEETKEEEEEKTMEELCLQICDQFGYDTSEFGVLRPQRREANFYGFAAPPGDGDDRYNYIG